MHFVVEDPQRADGITTYEPVRHGYDEATDMWSLVLENGGDEVERQIPRERIVYIEAEPGSPDGVTDR